MAEKYTRMLKAGVPKQSVEQAMTQDGCDSKMIQLVLSGGSSNSDSSNGGSDDSADFAAKLEKGGAAFKKYHMMLKAGVPIGAIEISMKRDGVSFSGSASSAPKPAEPSMAGMLKQAAPLKKAAPTPSSGNASVAPTQAKPAAIGGGGVMGELNQKLAKRVENPGSVQIRQAPQTKALPSILPNQTPLLESISKVSITSIDADTHTKIAAVVTAILLFLFLQSESILTRLMILLILGGMMNLLKSQKESTSKSSTLPTTTKNTNTNTKAKIQVPIKST